MSNSRSPSSTPSTPPVPPPPSGTDAKFVAPEPNPPSPWQRWSNFWFRPADPTTLGFIRITTGLLVLYIHLAYSLDLQSFFGEHGWYAARFIERERQESSYFVSDFFESWDSPPLITAQLSDFPLRRQALMQYLRSLPINNSDRAKDLAYLNRVSGYQNSADVLVALSYVQMIPSERELERHLTALTGGKVLSDDVEGMGDNKALDVTETYQPPPLFAELPQEQKRLLSEEIRAFWHSLERIEWEDRSQDRTYVLNHFVDAGPIVRKELVNFMLTLPTDETERKKLLDYLEYWNSDPRKAYRQGASIFSMWFHVTDPTQMALIHTGVLILIVLFTVGLFTRVTSALVWLATVSYIHRTQQVLFGMDTMMNILLFYLMIGNSGAALSFDRLIARYRAVRAALRRSGTIDANTLAFLACPPPSVSAGFGLRLIQIHFCFIYAAAGLSKLKGAMWWNGQAFWEVVVNPEFTLMQYQWYENGLRSLGYFKPIYYFMTATTVWFTLFIEIAGPFLLWTRLRWMVIFLATAMHAAIGVLMGLNLFELLMIVMLLAFLPDRVIRDRFRGGPNLPRLGFRFNPQNTVHARAASLVVATDADNQIALVPNPATPTTELIDPNGKPHSGGDGVKTLFTHVRFLSVLSMMLWIPGVRGMIAKYVYPSNGAATSGGI
jgi:hypothetical protein